MIRVLVVSLSVIGTVTGILTSVLVAGALPAHAETNKLQAFIIAKDKNKNLVHYDVKVSEKCTFESKDPFDIYWMTFKNDRYEREGLGFFEKMVYGVDITPIDDQEILVEVSAVKKRDKTLSFQLNLKKTDQGCELKTLTHGSLINERILLSTLKLRNFSGDTPRELSVIGKNPDDGKDVVAEVKI